MGAGFKQSSLHFQPRGLKTSFVSVTNVCTLHAWNRSVLAATSLYAMATNRPQSLGSMINAKRYGNTDCICVVKNCHNLIIRSLLSPQPWVPHLTFNFWLSLALRLPFEQELRLEWDLWAIFVNSIQPAIFLQTLPDGRPTSRTIQGHPAPSSSASVEAAPGKSAVHLCC